MAHNPKRRGRYICPECLMKKQCVDLERVYTRPRGSKLVPRGYYCPVCERLYPDPPTEACENDE